MKGKGLKRGRFSTRFMTGKRRSVGVDAAWAADVAGNAGGLVEAKAGAALADAVGAVALVEAFKAAGLTGTATVVLVGAAEPAAMNEGDAWGLVDSVDVAALAGDGVAVEAVGETDEEAAD